VSHDYDAEVRTITLALSEIAQTLDAVDHADERVRRTLELTRDLVPYHQCELLVTLPDHAPSIYVVPDVIDAEERGRLEGRLMAVLRLLSDEQDLVELSGRSEYVALPVLGLDRIVGVVRVRPTARLDFDARHIRLLSVVAAQLGAFFAMVNMHRELERQARKLAEANAFERMFLGIVSHDLRNPLAVITTTAGTLLAEARDERQARALRRALRAAEKANRLIADLLDVTRARIGGEMPVARRTSDLVEIVAEAVDDAKAAHPARQFAFANAVGDALVAQWDPDRVAQLLGNLLANAVQHGDERAPITVHLERTDDGAARIAVHNLGEPVPEELLAHVFDPFRHGRRPRSRGGGLGLGLYIVERIAHAHGGLARVTSSRDDGTTFEVCLPVLTTIAAPAPTAQRPERSEGSTSVLIVEDDDDIRLALADLLERRGYEVSTAANGADAFALLRAGQRPSLILLDLMMPVMDGEGFCDLLRDDPVLAEIPVLIVSADTAAAVKAERCRAAGFLVKPVSAETLIERLEDISHDGRSR
jgi:signal transduction histidine kinase/ActR/RegA family two-component response regulator